MKPGTVFLVGAGPGDPGLITVNGRRALERADAVFYDNLAPRELLEWAPERAERVYVGKKRAAHAYSQEEISRMLIERAREGKTVVRLKGGDPLTFGRGGEEIEALADAGIPFRIVPGVTTPSGIAAYCGVPLTHREFNSTVTFVTGHAPEKIDWEKVAVAETIVLFMGLTRFEEIARRLVAAGKPPETPALAVRWATRADQQTVAAPLAELAGRIREAGIKPPATFVIGEVVRLRDKLDWFEKLPLFGRRIVVTRAREQAAALTEKLRELGAGVIETPVIEIRELGDYSELDGAISRLESYDWLVFTSVNGVRFFLKRLDASARDWRSVRGRICAIGPATARELEKLHIKVDLTPQEYVAEALIEAFAPFPLEGRRVLIPRAKVAREVLPAQLRERGAEVDVVPAYETVMPTGTAERCREVLAQGVDWVTFTSSSTVRNFIDAAGAEALKQVRIASIGPVTSATVRSYGLEAAVEARPYTIDGLVSALCEAERETPPERAG